MLKSNSDDNSTHLRLSFEEIIHEMSLVGEWPPQILGNIIHVKVSRSVANGQELLLLLGICAPLGFEEFHADDTIHSIANAVRV